MFVGTFNGSATIEDLSKGLHSCVELSPNDRTRAIWDIRHLRVAFAMNEVYSLVQHVHGLDVGPGRFAFVTARSGFLAALIKQARAQPGLWRTEWNIVKTMEDAREWVNA